ncbi:four-carbon acid sugar kinase family protein [Edaphobacter dinghuensis]|uniref:Hrp-dependent type III effector protein n=1 Tax=Edaphobacter dinghuensis TaxID=1560005 RepID=A0A917M8L6_9BACT|nr:four-carbon acid sugar kinase family protein [Edaphobacter dinghuensis]GGG84271.1 hypothetical protein GCM10011585_30080 [Edaphobacter dinghuensis]
MPLLYTYYGDDFTGSTDVLEQLASNGVSAALFLGPPSANQLERFPGIQAFGIAGDSRSRSPEWMSANLPAIFSALSPFHAPITHYKVCSTFDSSPQHGSIGRAIELGIAAFDPAFVPVVVGAPHLRRFVFEGELFAAAPDGNIHRIDRHPMSHHPVTPMTEPNLCHHLARQTSLPIGLVAHAHLDSLASATSELEAQNAAHRIVFFDTVDPASLNVIGEILWQRALRRQLFSASSSGLTSALITAWRGSNLIPDPPMPQPIARANPLLIVSGSCSPTTAQQIRWALGHGFHGVPIDPSLLLSAAETSIAYRDQLIASAGIHLRRGEDTILYTALGASTSPAAGESLGIALGQLLNGLLAQTPVTRVILCGGDTSSHAVQQLGISALTWKASLQPGAPLCHAHYADSAARYLELTLKGGQIGTEDFFHIARGSC